MQLTLELEERLSNLASKLINQQEAKVIVPPHQNKTGFWFGGGNMIESGLMGRCILSGDIVILEIPVRVFLQVHVG